MSKRKPIVRDNRSFYSKVSHGLRSLLVFLLGCCLVLGLIITGLYYGSLRSFYQRLDPQFIVLTSSNLNAKDNPFYVINVDHEQQKITLVTINPLLKVSVLGGYGNYELRSIGALLNLEKKSPQYLRSAYALGLEQNFTDIALINTVEKSDRVQMRTIFWQILSNPSTKTTLSWWQRWQLFCFSWFLSDGKVEFKNIENVKDWQNWQKNKLSTLTSTCSLAIINSTDKAKLATKLGRVLENSGARVVRTTTEEVRRDRTQVLFTANHEHCQTTLQQIEDILPFNKTPTEINDDKATQYRADVVILVGDDLGSLVDAGAILQ